MDYKDLNLTLEKNNITTTSLESLANCFGHVTLSYKYYWMMALIQKVAVEGITDMPAMNLAIQMVGMAWQPICKHQLGLGYKDGFKSIIEQLRTLIDISAETSPFDVVFAIQSRLSHPDSEPQMRRLMNRLLINVPYCYLQPWTELNREGCIAAINQKSNVFEQNCTPYSLEYKAVGKKLELWVHVHPAWATLIRDNARQLYSFAMAGLYDYVSTRNPEIQSVEYMLDWRVQSEVHERQLYFWNQAIKGGESAQQPLHCIFTQNALMPNCYRIDHFLPAQFAESEKLWSIFPADLKANVSKTGNHYQEIGALLPNLAKEQQKALSNFLKGGGSSDFLAQDFGNWDTTIQQLISISPAEFAIMLRARFSAATSSTFNKYTGFQPISMIKDDNNLTCKISIQNNNGPINGGTSNFNH